MIILSRKDFGTKLIFLELIYVTFFSGIRDFFELPNAVSYVIDLMNISVMVWLLFYGKVLTEIYTLRLQRILYSVLLLLFAALLTAILNYVPPLLALWSTRNSFRFFPLFFALIIFWDKKAADLYSNALLWLQIPNAVVCLYQFFVKDLKGDVLGGLFGSVTGCNAYLCVFFFITVTIAVEKYLHGKLNLIFMGGSCISSMILSAFAELKVSFIVIPLIIIASFVLNKPSLKTFVLAAVVSYGMALGINLIVFYFPNWADSFSSVKTLVLIGRSTEGGYNISRLGAFTEINDLFFRNSIIRNAIGFGFGNCEYSHFDFLSSEFHDRYGVVNYRWFSHQMWFLQTGYLGIICYALFILAVFFWITKMKHRYGDPAGVGSYGQIMCGVMIINFVYNNSLIAEPGYILFAALAVPFVYYKEIIFNSKKKERQRRSIPSELQQISAEPEPSQIFY